MKKILLGLLLLCVNELVFADNSVILSVSDGAPGDTVLVQVSISASDRIVAAEFSVPIIEGLSFVSGSFKTQVTGMNFSSTFTGGALKVYYYNTSLDDSRLENGILFSFKVRLGRLPGIFRMQPSVILSDAEGKPIGVNVIGSDITVKAPQIVISTEMIDFGHVAIRSSYTKTLGISNTGTTPLNVFSLTGSSPELAVSETSFAVEPGETKELDVIYSPVFPGPGDMTMTIESDAAVNDISILRIVSDAYSINELKVGDLIGESDSVISVDVFMDNMEDIVALQCSFALPEGVGFVEGSFETSDRLNNMRSFLATDNNGVLKLYVYSESDGFIREGSGLVASFKLHLGSTNGKYDLVPENVILGNRDLVNVLSCIVVGSIEIKSPVIVCDTELNMGATSLTETATGMFLIQNNGKKDLIIENVSFDNGSFSLNEEFPIIVYPGVQKDIKISYNPEIPGEYSSIMRLYTNDPENRILEVDISGCIFKPNFISSDVVLNPDKKSGLLSVSLSNYNNITAVQMNIYGLEDMDVDKSSLSITDRCEGLSSVLTLNDDGSVKVFVYSLTNKYISGNNGELFSFIFSGSRVLDSNFSVSITDIVLSDEFGNNISSLDTMTVTVDELLPLTGDANNDGEVDVADITSVVNYIYGQQTYGFNVINADVNGNGRINVSDISGIISIISDINDNN